jgi:hypothetical protein
MPSRNDLALVFFQVLLHEIYISVRIHLEGQSKEIFTSDFFTDRFLPSLLLGMYRLFEFGFEFEEIFANFD